MFSRAKEYTIISIVISSLLSNTALPSNSFTDAETGLPTNPFTDMQAGIPADYALNSCVEYLFLQKVVFGYPDKTFRPNQIATPYEILMMRRKAFPIEPQSSMSNFASKDSPSRGSVAKDLCKSLGFVVTQFNHEFSIPRDEKLAMGTFIRILTAENKPTQIPFSNSRRPVKDFVKTLQASPKDAQSYYDRGVIRYYLTDFAGARKDLTKAIQMNSNLASAYYMRGCSSFNMWKRGEGKNPTVWGNEVVRKDFTKAIKLNSSLAEPYYYRVLISEFTGGQEATVDSDLAQAKSLGLNVNKIYGYRLMSLIEKTLYRKGYKSESFFDISSLSEAHLSLDEIQPIIKLISEAIQSNPNYSNQDFFQSLTDCTDPEDARKAVASLTQEVQRDPTSAEAFFNRGVAYHYLGNRSKSVSDFSKAIQLEPHEPDNYYYRGLIFYQDGSLKDAIEDFSKAIELKPTDEAFYLARCLAYSKFKDDKQAIENCDKVHQLHSQARLSRAPNSLEDIEDDDYVLDNAQIIKYIAGERSEASKKQFLESLDHFFVNPIMFRCQLFIDVRCPGGGGSLQVKEGLQQNIKVAKRRKL